MKTLPIKDLIDLRCNELSISYNDLIIKTGVSNVAKGHRRLQQLFDGDFIASKGLIEKLPEALGVDPALLDETIRVSAQQISDEVEADWRANFKPHALAITANNGRPRQITMAALCNAGRHVHIQFPEGMNPSNFKDYALKAVRKRAVVLSNFFYPLEGFVVNYTPDLAIKYCLQGEEIGVINNAVKAGKLSLTLR